MLRIYQFSMFRRVVFSMLVASLATGFVSCESAEAQNGRSRPGVRQSAFGWEAQGEHFVVLDPRSAVAAKALLDELEAGWQAADDWSLNWREADPKREETGLVPVRLAVPQRPNPGRPFRGAAETIEEAGEIVIPAELQDTAQDGIRRRLRTMGAVKQLEESGDAERLPTWVAEGLAEFVAGPQAPIDWFQAKQVEVDRSTQTGGVPSPEWITYLMTADDGAQAGALFDLLAQASGLPAPSYRNVPIGPFAYRRVDPPKLPAERFAALYRESEKTVSFTDWQQDASYGIPLIVRSENEQEGMPKQRQVEMAQLLKLARKYGPDDARLIADEKANAQPENLFPNRVEPQVTLEEIKVKLTGGKDKNWTTLDSSGRLLTWQDRESMSEFLSVAKREYRFVWQENQSMLEWRSPDGTGLRAWLTVDDKAPSRPLVKFKKLAAEY